MSPLDVCHLALVAVGGLVVLLWALPAPCRCEKCGFHVNERRLAALQQVETKHDYEHKGPAFRNGDPDRYPCADDTCPRNPPARDA